MMVVLISSFLLLFSFFSEGDMWKDLSANILDSSHMTQENPQGVKRKVSYIGRIRNAEELIEHEYYSRATIELATAIKEKPDIIKPYLLLGEIYLRKNDIPKLSRLIEELKQKFPTEIQVSILEGRKLIAEEKFQEVTLIFNSIQEKLPPELQFYQAALLSLQNNHEKAKEILQSLNKLPIQEEKLIVGKEGVKEEEVDKEVSISPEFAQKINDFLVVYNDFSLLSDGKNAHLFVLLGKVLAEKNEVVLAREFAEVAVTEDLEYPDAWLLRGYTAFLAKNFESALRDLRQAYKLDPARPQTSYFLALALSETGQNEEAILFFEKANEYGFEFASEVEWKLVELFNKQRKYDQALKLYQKLVDQDTQPKQIASALHTAIDLASKPEAALEMAEKLIENKPNDAFALNMYGWSLIANKKFVQAEEALQKAEKLVPENAQTFLNLGLLYETQSEFKKAISYYQKSYQLGKKSPNNSIANLAAEKYNELKNRSPQDNSKKTEQAL